MDKKICRLCLQTISGSFQQIGEMLKDLFKLNLSISKETVACTECTNNLKIFFNLKSACIDMRKRKLSITPDLKSDVSEPKDEKRCSFCTKSTVGESLISLHDSKENIFLVDVLTIYIPELNLNNIGELLSCQTCLDEVQNVSNFLMKCSDVENKINKYTEIEGTDDKGRIELQNVQQFIFEPVSEFKGESYHLSELRHEDLIVKTESKETYEMKVDNVNPFIKIEEVDIKSEQSDCDSFQEFCAKIKWDMDHNNSLDLNVYHCDMCTYMTAHKNRLEDHILTHKNAFRCEMCAFETKHKQNLKQHKLVHKSTSKVTMHKCDNCTYETKRKQHLNDHKLIHKDPSEITMFKCGICTFEAKRKYTLKSHMAIHKSPSEITLFQCGTCTFRTKRKWDLNQHELTHRTPPDIKMFKCEICTFDTGYKRTLTRHMLSHKDPTHDFTKLKCEMCTFETRYRSRLTEHELAHKDPSEVTMFKCAMCTYETKRKRDLTRHLLTHKNPSEVTKVKCEMCAYETIHKNNLKRHILTHKTAPKYKCDFCSYETKQKWRFSKHKLIHKSPPEITMFKCEICSFQTKYRRYLEGPHMKIHT